MSSQIMPLAGYEDLLRGGPRDSESFAIQGGRLRLASQPTALANSMDIQQLSDMLDAQFHLREAAQTGRAQAIRALVATAEALCPSQWDGQKRSGLSPEEWTPEQIGEFIARHTLTELQRVYIAQQPNLLAEYERTSRELTTAREEIGRMKLYIQQLQALARTAAEQLAQAAKGNRNARDAWRPVAAGPVETEPPAVSDDQIETARKLEAVPPNRIEAVLRLMATTGLSRSDEIREQLAAAWGVKRGSSRIGEAVRATLHHGLAEAFPCVVEWPGERTRQFLVLTPTGRARAIELQVVPIANEYETGMQRHATAEQLYLVLTATDILRAEGHEAVTSLSKGLQVAGSDYCPDIEAREDGRLVYIECERSTDKAREANWNQAAQANGGMIRLVTPTRKIMDAITSEIKATTGSQFKIWAFNISEYAAGSRGPNGSVWTHQR